MNIQEIADFNRLKTRVDEDGAKIIPGKLGHIYEYDEDTLGVMVMPDPPRKQYWGHTKRTLAEAGFVIRQDGDGEGVGLFDPQNPGQLKLALRAARIRRRRIPSEKQMEVIRRMNPRIAQKAPSGLETTK